MAVLTWTVLTITCGVLCAPTNWDSSGCGSCFTSLGMLYAAGDWDSSSCGSCFTSLGMLYAAGDWNSSSCWNCSFSHGRLCTTADCQRWGGFRGQHCREKPHNIAQAYHTDDVTMLASSYQDLLCWDYIIKIIIIYYPNRMELG